MRDNKIVIFINISFNSFAMYTDAAFVKLNSLFETYCDKKDYLLWWRPHPRLENDLKNHNECLYQKYITLKKRYIDAGLGVFDIDELFANVLDISDIYYGDCGTVVQEFIKRGKRVIYPNYTGLFFPLGISKLGNYIYGTDHDTSAIVRYDIQMKNWEYVSMIDSTAGMKKAFHNSVVIDNNVYFIPYMADCLVKYDIFNKSISVIELNINSKKLGKKKTYFFGFYYYNDHLYLIPASYSDVLSVDLTTGEIIELFDLSDVTDQGQIITWLSWKEIESGVVAFVSMQRNQVLILDFNKNTKKIYDIGDSKYKYNAIRMKDNIIYLIVKNAPVILEWKYKEGIISEIRFDENTFGDYGISIFDDHATCIFNNKLFCLPAKSRAAYSIDLTSKLINQLEVLDKYMTDDLSESQFDTVTIGDDKIFIQNWQYKFLTFDLKTENVIEEAECKLSLMDTTRMEMDLIRNGRIKK